jgi:class 3 adenylate cyclase
MERFLELLQQEVNVTLRRGSFYAALLGFFSGFIIFSLEFAGLVHHFTVPGIWAFLCGIYSLFAYVMARYGLIRGWMQYLVLLPFVSLPSILFVISYFLLPSGTATYITGPASYLYFFVIIMTGFLFNRRLSTLSGLFAGIQYFVAYLLGAAYLQQISSSDPLMLQDIIDTPIYFFKSLMMVFSGVVVGILSSNTRKLISNILQEEDEKHEAERKRDMIKDLFGKYVADEVRDEVLSGRIPLDGEMKDVTVMFADLRNFTPMTEANDPKTVVKIMNSYFAEMAEAIQQHGGLVLQFLGDEIYAVFGAPVARQDHPARAIRAGLEMNRRLIGLNERLTNQGLPNLRHGIGIHTGQALAANIGSPDRLSYLLVGDTINLASRLQSLTKEVGTALIMSAETREYLTDTDLKDYELRRLPSTPIKGKSQPVEIYAMA